MMPTPPIETTTEDMMDNPPVRHNDGLFAANHGINQKPPVIDTFDTASLSITVLTQSGNITASRNCYSVAYITNTRKVSGSIMASKNVYPLGWKENSSTMVLTLETSLSSLKMEPLRTHQSPSRSWTLEFASLKGRY
jgi:hypothetical protein